jgi:positive regulator of sigma E activity
MHRTCHNVVFKIIFCLNDPKLRRKFSFFHSIVAIVQNDAHADPGDFVEITRKRNALLGSAALLHIVPVLCLLLGAFAGSALSAAWGIGESSAAALAGLAGLAVGLLAVAWFGRTEFARARLVPHIVGIIESAAGERGKTISPPAFQESNRACCS